jgi:hypothetical protein
MTDRNITAFTCSTQFKVPLLHNITTSKVPTESVTARTGIPLQGARASRSPYLDGRCQKQCTPPAHINLTHNMKDVLQTPS